jgi:hypothetical protein
MDHNTGTVSMTDLAGLPELGELTAGMLDYKRKLDAVLRSPLVTGDAIASQLVEHAIFSTDPEDLARIMEELAERVRQVAEEKYGVIATSRNRAFAGIRGNVSDDDDVPQRMVLKL